MRKGLPNKEQLKKMTLSDLLALHTILSMDDFVIKATDDDAILNYNRKVVVRQEISNRKELIFI